MGNEKAPESPRPNFGVYIHVPFCTTRCGYCDFNTYIPSAAADPATYLEALEAELQLAVEGAGVGAEVEGGTLDLGSAELGPADTVFIGGGTPSLLGADGLNRILTMIRNTFGISEGAEITTESNPESTSPEFFEGIREGGYTRVSLGMQSTAPHVLKVLERTHRPGRALEAAREAHAAGFEHINLDMIYGTPTETRDDVKATVEAMLSTPIDHVSAYSLIVEDGTAMARKVNKGEYTLIEEDELAARYEMIDSLLVDAGFHWYEVSNWSKPGGECRHNLGYWQNFHWWGAGPGAHSYINRTRFFNQKLPRKYADAIAKGWLPIAGQETLSEEDLYFENLMLGLRLYEGIPESSIHDAAQPTIEKFIREGLIERYAVGDQRRIRVTSAGRLLADGIITDIALA
ncbi:MAG: radical SAM family heme chaperone HemW [Corynebacterium sp.]|nr:radical SAM family heme chaperone HemW [Corynebacterium sp.]